MYLTTHSLRNALAAVGIAAATALGSLKQLSAITNEAPPAKPKPAPKLSPMRRHLALMEAAGRQVSRSPKTRRTPSELHRLEQLAHAQRAFCQRVYGRRLTRRQIMLIGHQVKREFKLR